MLRFATILICLSISSFGSAQLSITTTATNFTIDFSTTVAGVNNGVSTGSGFAGTPAAGELDADGWATSGLSDGAKAFGANNTAGDHARGTSTGGVTTGGIYGFDHGGGNIALGWQPGGSDATPGSITLEFVNNTGVMITSLDVSYNILEYNNEDRQNDIRLSHDGTGTNGSGDLGTLEGSVTYLTTTAAAGSPSWVSAAEAVSITGLTIANGASYFIRWATNDVAGSGSRDEFAFDDIVLNANPVACVAAAEPTTNASASGFTNIGCTTMDLSWVNGNGANRIVVMSTSAIAGTPTDQIDYTASTVFGSGSIITAGEFVIFNGAGTTVSVSGLAPATTYFIAVFEYNGTTANCTENYLMTSAHTNSQASITCPYGLIINEIYVDAGVNDGSPNPDTGEWIEFYNEGSSPIDVSCYSFCDGDFCVTFPSGTVIAANDYFLVGSAVGVSCGGCDFPGQSMDLDWGTSGCTSGTTIGTFTNGAEQVVLFDNTGAIVDAVEWGGGQALPVGMTTVAGCGCESQSVTLPTLASGEYESLGSTTDQTSFERAVDASGTWTTEPVPTVDATNGAALPVSLLSFKGEKFGDDNKLLWTTASEENNYGFEIWRSADGIRFEFIGFKDGAGTSVETNSYELIDYNPLDGINYYRLTQIDFDGERTKYPMIALNNDSDVLNIDSWSNENELTEIRIDGFKERMPINVNIIDISGRIVYTEVHQPSSNLYVHGFAFSQGVYILSIEQGGQRAMEKIKF